MLEFSADRCRCGRRDPALSIQLGFIEARSYKRTSLILIITESPARPTEEACGCSGTDCVDASTRSGRAMDGLTRAHRPAPISEKLDTIREWQVASVERAAIMVFKSMILRLVSKWHSFCAARLGNDANRETNLSPFGGCNIHALGASSMLQAFATDEIDPGLEETVTTI